MLNGHGDDIYRYPDIRVNFSSNICQHADHSLLKAHLMARFDVIANYPEPEALSLEQALAKKLGIAADSVLVTNGATEAIYLIAQAYAHLPYRIIHPTFSEYEDACRMYGLRQGRGGLIWLCCPNNPDGSVHHLKTIDDDELLVIDQAYECYTQVRVMTAAEAVADGRVIQLHSLTKTYAVPGLRLGYITASPAIIRRLRTYLRPWSVNALAIEAARFLLEHDELRVIPDFAEAQRLNRLLNKIDGVAALPTETNYMLCRIEQCTAARLKEYLAREHGMLIRDASNFRGLNEHFFRVAAQLPEENDALLKAIVQLTMNN